MRISIRRRFVFLSNPRCGSQSIRAMLDPHADIFSTAEKPFHHHANAQTVRRALRRLGFDWNEFYSFTTIRNPWKRAVSFWQYGAANPASVWHRRREEAGSFDAFCETIPAGTAAIRFCGDGERYLVRQIVRLEDLQRDYPKIAEALGITPPLAKQTTLKFGGGGAAGQIIHNNRTEEIDHRALYTPRSRDHIASLFASDIALGGYRFDDR